eukprot:SAG31_NODE_4245_length_3422_cov_11.228408_3_plen_50_part_00
MNAAMALIVGLVTTPVLGARFFTSVDKMQILKVYELSTIKEIAYVLNLS